MFNFINCYLHLFSFFKINRNVLGWNSCLPIKKKNKNLIFFYNIYTDNFGNNDVIVIIALMPNSELIEDKV